MKNFEEGRGFVPKSFVDKHLRTKINQKKQGPTLDMGRKLVYNTPMKNTFHVHAWTVISASSHIETHQCIDCGEKRTIYVD